MHAAAVMEEPPGLKLPLDEAARVRIASRGDTSPELLHLLASDPAVVVRAAAAMNPNCAPASNGAFAVDRDERVRALLATKLARLLPDLSAEAQGEALGQAHETLRVLAADAATRVRATLANAVSSMEEVPRAVLLALAHDSTSCISEPVLRLSPLLTDTDLLELLAAPPHDQVAAAVARRTHVSVAVADAIAERADATAIRALLQNRSAHIRETTLDGLIGRAAHHPEWHEPLVQRPWLAERAVRALSLIVTKQLLSDLLARPDIPEAVADEIRARVAEADGEDTGEAEEEALSRLRARQGSTSISEASLLDAATMADRKQMKLLLTVASGATLSQVDRALATRNAKAMVCLVWRAGFTMRAAKVVQTTLGALSPAEILEAGTHGTFPFCTQEMEWQLERLAAGR